MNTKIEVVHTWRDGSFLFRNEYDFERPQIGAVVVMERFGLSELFELRHLKGQKATSSGEFFHWIRTTDGALSDQHLGRTREENLPDAVVD